MVNKTVVEYGIIFLYLSSSFLVNFTGLKNDKNNYRIITNFWGFFSYISSILPLSVSFKITFHTFSQICFQRCRLGSCLPVRTAHAGQGDPVSATPFPVTQVVNVMLVII